MAYRSCTNTSARIRQPRIASLAIMVALRFHLSTNTPAIGLKIASGVRNETRIMLICTGVPCRLNVTYAITAKIARKSPKTLTICAIQSRFTAEFCNTSRKDRGVAGVDIWEPPLRGGDYHSIPVSGLQPPRGFRPTRAAERD